MGPFVIMTKINAINSSLMSDQTEICSTLRCADCPYLDGLVERGRREHVCIFWVDGQLHDIMFVVIICVNAVPILIPIKHHNSIIVTTAQNI